TGTGQCVAALRGRQPRRTIGQDAGGSAGVLTGGAAFGSFRRSDGGPGSSGTRPGAGSGRPQPGAIVRTGADAKGRRGQGCEPARSALHDGNRFGFSEHTGGGADRV